MFSVFWKSLFVSLLFLLMWINIAFAFNVLDIMNPTNVLPNADEYYFGVSSFIEQFKVYFGNNSVLTDFQAWLNKFGAMIRIYFDKYVSTFRSIGWEISGWEVISLLLSLLFLMLDIVPMFMLILMGLFYIIYLLLFAFEIVLFVIAFFGGAFATPLPSTDWWEYTPTISTMATIV